MKFLFDTHILLAVIGRRLHLRSPKIARLLSQDDSDPYASVASLWEIAIKTRLGKLNPRMSLALLPSALQALEIGIVPITQAHALVSVESLPPTKDPFDRMLLAQCQVEGCLLVTVDGALHDHPLAARI
ncbi:type II toxin-antitoxin system VapC family toxin [Methylobacterium sp. J-088]|uniref:type II toxin-antitoxin system VapC family toxin n=1 Tax=Methylobacterium sp. J-088 TaxID=2836664 RepID=UPI001FBB2B22|nr:type II toxin-antitoxin system VapC family toxin [Methylobacterium sp. J-088]MCJ2064546.1 type II toxin-antitoxin system VapC family toxin [Methylobacterium sp. J-088]